MKNNMFEFKAKDGSVVTMPIRAIDPKTEHLIPKKRDYKIETAFVDQIVYTVTEAGNVLIQGEPGCGKSEFVLWLASETNTPVVQIQGDGDMSVVDIIGGFQYSKEAGTYWVDGMVPFALKNKCWLLFDEINMVLPEVLSRLHSVTDGRRHLDLKEIGTIVGVPAETVIWGTMNPSDDGRHVGTKPLSPALLSRFDLVVRFDFLSPELEEQLLIDRTGVDKSDAKKIVQLATEARKGFRNQEVTEIIDTRMTLAWAKMTKKFGLKKGIQCTVLSRLDEGSFDVLRGVLMAHGIVEAEGKGKKA